MKVEESIFKHVLLFIRENKEFSDNSLKQFVNSLNVDSSHICKTSTIDNYRRLFCSAGYLQRISKLEFHRVKMPDSSLSLLKLVLESHNNHF